MSSFFIRGKKDQSSKRKISGKLEHGKNAKKGRISNVKPRKRSEQPAINNDEEILSSDADLSDVELTKSIPEDEEQLTAQEKKLQLAKKYIEEIEREERERLESSEVSADILANRLKEEALSQAGKLKKKVADKLQTVNESNIHVLRNKDHKLSITCVVISSDNQHIYSASKDCFIVKWNILEKCKVKSISSAYKLKDKSKTGHSDVILSLAISHDNKFLASGDNKFLIYLWNPVTLDHIFTFKGHKAPITGLAICRDTNNLYSSSGDRSVKVWNLEEMMYVETLFGHQSSVTSIDVLCKDRTVSSGGIDNTNRVWKIEEESQLLFNGNGRTIDVVKRIDDHHFVSCGEDGLVCIWGITKKKPIHYINNAHEFDNISKEPNWIVSIASMPMSDVFASGSSNGCVKLWKIEERFRNVSLLFTIPIKGFINSMVFSSDEKYLILGVGQEHKLGRWSKVKEAKNSVVVIELTKKNLLSNGSV